MVVREKNDLLQWLKFFLVGVIETAQSSIDTFDKTLQLQREVDEKIQSLGRRAANAQKVVHYLYQRPVINVAIVARVAEISSTPAYKLIADLERLEIIKEMTGAKRGRTYLFTSYVNLFT
jgi:Fic family protein